MAVAELSTPSYTKTHLFQSSQLSSLSTHLHSHRRVAFRPLPHTQNARICCSVAPNQVQAPAAPAQTEDPKNKPECFGVFCLTYNLKADEELIAAYNQVIHFLKIANKLEPQVLKIQGVLKINESLKKEVDELQRIRVGLLGALLV